MKRKSFIYWIIALITIGSLTIGIYFNRYKNQPYIESRYLMDTYITLKIYGRKPSEVKQAAQAVFERLKELETKSNRFGDQNSEVVTINNNAGQKEVPVSEEIWKIITASLDYGEKTSGAFDLTSGPLVDLWGINGEHPQIPSPEEIKDTLALVDYKEVETIENNRSVRIAKPEMSMDLGGSAKGYALDLALEVLKEHGIEHALVDLVSSTAALGSRPDGKPWRLGLQPPRALKGEANLAIIPIENQFISTSGDYQRFFEENGVRYHHILDPQTGYPAKGVTSVTIVTSTNGLDADILSTAVFVLGPERGMELIEKLPGVEGLMVDSDLNVLTSSGFKAENLKSYH